MAAFVDVVIPVHDESRPLSRAVASVLEGDLGGDVRVIVVAHGLDKAVVEAILPQGLDPSSVIVVPFSDGIKSPAGPFNHGLSLATAPYISVMGSDDFLEPGAMASWVRWVKSSEPDAALVRLRYQNGEKLDNPLPRWRRTTRLDVVRDRLFYRTAPLGLLRREYVEKENLLFTAGMPVGKDMAFSARMWTAARKIEYLRDEPCYVIGDDATSRVTTQARPVKEAMMAVLDLIHRPWVADLPVPVKRALVIKIMRVHVLGAATNRPLLESWDASCASDLGDAARAVLAVHPKAMAPFAKADRQLFDAILRPHPTASGIIEAVSARATAPRVDQVLTRNPLHVFDRESTLTRYMRYRLG